MRNLTPVEAAFAAANDLFAKLDQMREEEIEMKVLLTELFPVGSTQTLKRTYRLGCVTFPVGTEVEVEGCTAALDCYFVNVTVDGYELGVDADHLVS